MFDPYANFTECRLSNGLKVHVSEWKDRAWEAFGVVVHSGADADPIGYEGTAHFVEHLVSKNAPLAREDLHRYFEECGGRASFGSTGYPYTDYDFFVPCDQEIFDRGVSLFGSMLLLGRLERFVERERKVIVGEFHRKFPLQFAFDQIMIDQRAKFPGHWYSRFATPLGDLESIGKITKDGLQSFYDTHYTPKNMSIVCVGGLSPEAVVRSLEKSPFGERKAGERNPAPAVIHRFPILKETRRTVSLSEHVRLDVPAKAGVYTSHARLPGNTSYAALDILEAMLDHVLDEEVRQKRGWTYSIGSAYTFLRDIYEFSILCNGLSLEGIDQIDEVVDACIKSISEKKDLFETEKKILLARALLHDPGGQRVRDTVMKDLGHRGRIITLAEDRSVTEEVTMEKIREILQWLKPERRWTVLMRP